ncbi:MAG: choice-of-anchor Q domain-containing protein [Dehalococcoidia bacterium]
MPPPRPLNSSALQAALLIALALLLFLASDQPARAGAFIVDSTADAEDANRGDGVCATADGQCTLRAAIEEANALAGPDTITLPAGTYTLALDRLVITDDLTLAGDGPDLTIIDGNSASRVLFIEPNATVDISGVTIRNGNSGSSGGGIANGGTLTLTDSVVADNTAGNSGGGINNFGSLTLIDSIVTGNTASFAGGGISTSEGTLELRNTTVSGSTVDGIGGGIYNLRGTIVLTNTTVSGNMSGGGGGGINNQPGSTLILANVTISGNTATESFPAIVNVAGSTVTMTNVTVTGNTSPNEFVAAIANHGTMALKNTIIANSGVDCFGGDITSLGHNLDSDGTCGLTEPTDLPNVDPLLGLLADNGGPTLTHALLPGSPAIDAGDNAACPATDQRGIARPQGAACDIGAYEFGGAVPTPSPSPSPSPTPTPGPALPIEDQLGDCFDVTSAAWGHDNQAKVWQGFFPGQPLVLQDLTEFLAGAAYLVNVSANCTVSFGANAVNLYTGWNLFGWR